MSLILIIQTSINLSPALAMFFVDEVASLALFIMLSTDTTFTLFVRRATDTTFTLLEVYMIWYHLPLACLLRAEC